MLDISIETAILKSILALPNIQQNLEQYSTLVSFRREDLYERLKHGVRAIYLAKPGSVYHQPPFVDAETWQLNYGKYSGCPVEIDDENIGTVVKVVTDHFREITGDGGIEFGNLWLIEHVEDYMLFVFVYKPNN